MNQLSIDNQIEMEKDAIFSDCKKYRYALTRKWDSSKQNLVFIMLNPSTADDKIDDPTIKRCMGFARDLGFGSIGYGGIYVVNLFAFRATNPTELIKIDDPIGPLNNRYLKCVQTICEHGLFIAAWGNHGSLNGRDLEVVELFKNTTLYCLGTTSTGMPRHPLYVPANKELEVYSRKEED